MAHTQRKISITKLTDPRSWCKWAVLPPDGMAFDKDPAIGRGIWSVCRLFLKFEDARQYVASGAAQRALIPMPKR